MLIFDRASKEGLNLEFRRESLVERDSRCVAAAMILLDML